MPRGITDPRRKKPKYGLTPLWRTAVVTRCTRTQSVREATQIGQDHESRLDRLFAASVPVNRLKPCEVVRRHWRIENECFWTLDTRVEGRLGPVGAQRFGWSAASSRMIAYNIVALLRYLHKKSESWRRRPGRSIADLLSAAWTLTLAGGRSLPGCGPTVLAAADPAPRGLDGRLLGQVDESETTCLR